MKKLKKLSVLLLLVFLTTLSMGAKSIDTIAKKVYRVYLDGKSLGLIESKEDLEEYINKEQESLKQKYNVDKIYVPDNLHIQEEITYNEKIKTTKEIYEMIKDNSYFTLKGYKITIKDNEDDKDKKIIYVLKKKVFTEAVDRTVRSFISAEDYEIYSKNKKQEIVDTGKIVENITLENDIKITKQNIPANKKIYMDVNELTKYLLFGNDNSESSYTIKAGDTISSVANENKMSTEEFLLMNPSFKNENALLYEGEEVKTGILNPQIKVAQVDEQVSLEEKKYSTETKYDNSQSTSYYQVEQQGVNGTNKVTQKIKKINGEITNIVAIKTEEVKPVVNEVVIRGSKKQSNYDYYTGGQYGDVVATAGTWGWPASCSSVSSGFGYRWGTLHDGMDIAGCGYGSNIFAAQDGTVVTSMRPTGGYPGGYGQNGEYIIIDHHNGFFTLYAHMCPGCRYVQEGENVTKGQVIGGMGHTGSATGTHLHFALWSGFPYRGGKALNPMSVY